MRINDIFNDLANAGLSESLRIRTQNLVRKIIVGRSELVLCNDVVSLYVHRNRVASHLQVPTSHLDVIWDLPSVRAHMKECATLREIKDHEHEHTTGDTTSDGDWVHETSNETSVGSDMDSVRGRSTVMGSSSRGEADSPPPEYENRLDQIASHVRSLRRELFWFGSVLLVLHFALVYTVIFSSSEAQKVEPFSVMSMLRHGLLPSRTRRT